MPNPSKGIISKTQPDENTVSYLATRRATEGAELLLQPFGYNQKEKREMGGLILLVFYGKHFARPESK